MIEKTINTKTIILSLLIAVFFTQQSGAQDIVSAASALPIEDGTVRNTDNSVLQDTIDLAQDSVIENPNEIVTDTTLSNEQVSGEKEYMDYNLTKEYTIADITVSGNVKYDQQTLVMLSGLAVGQKITIPGDRISNAMELFWKQGNFGNVEITAAKISGDHIYLNIYLEESPKLSTFEIQGIKRMDASNLKDEIDIKEGSVVTPNSIRLIKNKSEEYYKGKGFLNAHVDVIQKYDSLTDGIKLIINVNKRKRVKIQKIVITGNEYKKPVDETEQFHGVKQFWRNIKNTEGVQFTDKSIKKKLKHTKEKTFWRFWKRSKFVEPDFKEDKEKVLAMYNKNGFRDAKIMNYHYDTVNSKRIKLSMEIYEGRPYYFGDITFVGNTKYSSEQLGRILDIEKGDVYNEEKLSQNIQFNQQNGDIFSLYYDDGYLTFQAIPVEISNDNDTINLEIRIQEGKQAKFKRVGVKGNTRTNDYVIVRELRAYPGQLFSRSDLISSMNELRMLRYFNDQTINPDVKPNFDDATADVTFQVEEVGSDQLELSGGWGAGQVVGTLGLTFNNFSIQNIFKRDRWKPLPSGDGQQFSIRAQSSGTRYWTISTSFTEPWLGGRKPLSLSVSYYHTQESTGLYKKSDSRFSGMTINGFVVGLGQRLRWPDNYFTLYQSVGYQKYDLNKYNYFRFPTGNFNNLSYTVSLTRQSLDAAIFPKNGSEFGLSLQLTPPYSLMNNKDYGAMEEAERYKWLEYYKWTFKAGMYMNPVANLVLNARMRLGLLNYYDHSNSALDYPPMERFYVGGDGLSGFSLGGRDLIGLRGYPNNSLSADDGSCAFSKFTFEMRYPLTTNPMATIYVLSFVEAGAAWDKPSDINPFNLYKSAGFGVRLFMAAMGMFGLDWGYGFDRLPGATSISGGRMHFSINQSLDW